MSRFVRVAMALASIAIFAPALAEAQRKPVIAVLPFDNNSFGKDAADYTGVGKGMADLLTNDLLSNATFQVVERDRIQALMIEQNLTREKSIDPATAIRLGKIIGAQYVITGAFMSDGRGTYTLTGRAINMETSVISNPARVTSKGDDVLGMISQFTAKLSAELKLPALQVGQGAAPGAVPAGLPAQAAAPAQENAPRAVVGKTDPRPAEKKPAQVAQARPSRKMDMKTAMLYSKALEEEDAGNKSKAIDLYRQVSAKFPEYAPVQRKLASLARG